MRAEVVVNSCRRLAARRAIATRSRGKIVYASGYWHGFLPIKKPALGGLGDSMEFVDYMWLKLGVFVVGAIIYGFWLGLTGR
jgi:hypothetical protein